MSLGNAKYSGYRPFTSQVNVTALNTQYTLATNVPNGTNLVPWTLKLASGSKLCLRLLQLLPTNADLSRVGHSQVAAVLAAVEAGHSGRGDDPGRGPVASTACRGVWARIHPSDRSSVMTLPGSLSGVVAEHVIPTPGGLVERGHRRVQRRDFASPGGPAGAVSGRQGLGMTT